MQKYGTEIGKLFRRSTSRGSRHPYLTFGYSMSFSIMLWRYLSRGLQESEKYTSKFSSLTLHSSPTSSHPLHPHYSFQPKYPSWYILARVQSWVMTEKLEYSARYRRYLSMMNCRFARELYGSRDGQPSTTTFREKIRRAGKPVYEMTCNNTMFSSTMCLRVFGRFLAFRTTREREIWI